MGGSNRPNVTAATESLSDANPIVALTEPAAAQVRVVMDETQNDYLRIAVEFKESTGYSYKLSPESQMSDNDRVSYVHGIPVVMNKAIVALMRGTTIDYVNTETERGFVIKNPNAECDPE